MGTTAQQALALAMVVAMAAISLLNPAAVTATPLTNGDFSDPTPLAGWTPSGAIVDEPTGEFGQLETDGIVATRTLEQGFTLPDIASVLTFDFAFSTDIAGPAAGFPDSFAASLVTLSGDYLDILVVDLEGVLPDPSEGIEWLTGALPIDVDFDPTVTIPGFLGFAGGTSFSGHINMPLPSSVLGQDAFLYFDLFDKQDGASTRAAVDNIAVTARAAPAPDAFALVLLGWILAFPKWRPRCAARR